MKARRQKDDSESAICSSDLIAYKKRRETFYLSFKDRWPGTFTDAYDLLDPYPLTRAEIKKITQAANAVGHIYERTAVLLRTVPDEALLQMGLPPETICLSQQQIHGLPDVVIGRLDLAKTPTGYKMLEFNSDTCGLILETFAINAKVCEASGTANPNQDAEGMLADSLQRAVGAALAYVGKTRDGNVVFTTSKRFASANDITSYLTGLVNLPAHVRKQEIPLEMLRADQDGLYDSEGRTIDVLCRFYPLLFFRGEMFRDHQSGRPAFHDGRLLIDLLRRRRLATINPPSAFMLGSKAVQAVIWGLCEAGRYFTKQERSIIKRHFLPTYLDRPAKDERYVIKPVYGAEGDSVRVVTPQGILSDDTSTYLNQPMIYQKYVELPADEVMTEFGPKVLRLLMSCFLINGEPAGITLRAGEGITNISWWSVPVCLAD